VSFVVRAIRESEMGECLRLWQTIWPDNTSGYFERYFYGDHEFQPEYTRVGITDGRIVSATHIVKRIVSCGDFTLTLGGVANVATRTEYRNRGYGSACLNDAVGIMQADAMDLSLLFTGRYDFYARAGYEVTPNEWAEASLNVIAAHLRTDYTVRPYVAADDSSVRQIHKEFNAGRPLTVQRSDPYWRDWIRWSDGRSPGHALVAEKSGAVAAYSCFCPGNVRGKARVLEIGCADGHDSALTALISTIGEQSAVSGAKTLLAPLPHSPRVAERLQDVFCAIGLTKTRSTMVRFLRLESLLFGLMPELTGRWMAAGSPVGALRFRDGEQTLRVDSASGFPKITIGPPTEDALGHADLLGLLAHGSAAVPINAANAAFAAALFPKAEGWFWSLDGF
jgi:hypothetical protein